MCIFQVFGTLVYSQIHFFMTTQKELNNLGPSQSTLRKSIDITFHNVSYSIQIQDKQSSPFQTKYIQQKLLRNVSGVFKAGQVTAIMGASGAGKTTLLNVLACRVPRKKLEGKICANGVQYTFQSFGNFANYVMQTDVLMQTLTVRETLQFAANLKLDLSEKQKTERINLLSKELKLQKCLDVIVGGVLIKGISGGERKRTSIAFELISDPNVLMLDEPTSGLDSLTSFVIIKYLKKLAVDQNKTILMTIHQPSSEIFQLFDKLILLVNGKIIYQGLIQVAREYFHTNFGQQCPQFCNPGDYYMSIIHQQSVFNRLRYLQYFRCYDEKIYPSVEKQIQNTSNEQIQKRIINVPFCTSFKTLLHRDLVNVIRNPMLVKLRFIQTVFISIFFAGVYCKLSGEYENPIHWQAYTGFFFYLGILVMMMAFAVVEHVFPTQRPVFLKEEGAKLYSVTSYFLSRNIIEIPYSIIFPLLQALIIYWFVGLSSTVQQFFTFYLICYFIGFAGSSLGFFVGSMVQDSKSANAVTPMLVLPLILFSGLFKNTGNIPDWLGWIQYLSPLKYGSIAFLQNEVLYAQKSNLYQMNFDLHLWSSIGTLIALGFGFRLCGLFFLWLLRTKLQ